jgi:hypothetical protein
VMSDYQYKRLGTLSILEGMDLQDGHVISQVHDTHQSCEFVSLLNELDDFYPVQSVIHIFLDNHSAHISKETMKYLVTRPDRFHYVHTPKHGSRLK